MLSSKTRRKAFTLVELLTVITIISILIAVLLPSLQQARIAAKNAASQSGLHALDVGIEMFRNDPANDGQYPPSHTPVLSEVMGKYTGANRLADALIGPDMLGWDPRALNPSEVDDAWNVVPASGVVHRVGPYVDVDSTLSVIDEETDIAVYWQEYPSPSGGFGGGGGASSSRVIVDESYYSDTIPGAFNNAVLYYRANPTAQTTWGLAATGAATDLIYNFQDNAAFWHGDAQDLLRQPSAAKSPLYVYQDSTPPPPPDVEVDWPVDSLGTFYEFIENKEAAGSGAPFRRPRKADSFILMVPGADGLYGTTDDITNFKR